MQGMRLRNQLATNRVDLKVCLSVCLPFGAILFPRFSIMTIERERDEGASNSSYQNATTCWLAGQLNAFQSIVQGLQEVVVGTYKSFPK